jgi:hypothetical protein
MQIQVCKNHGPWEWGEATIEKIIWRIFVVKNNFRLLNQQANFNQT